MKFLKFIVISAGLYFAFVLILVFDGDISNYLNRTDFDSTKWKEWVETETTMSLRWDMVEDLQQNHHLNGLTEQEIVELLGEPSSKSKVEWSYNLGMARRGIDTGTLTLKFENGNVKSYEVWTG